MFEPENRDDGKPSLSAYGGWQGARAARPYPGSLLAIGKPEDGGANAGTRPDLKAAAAKRRKSSAPADRAGFFSGRWERASEALAAWLSRRAWQKSAPAPISPPQADRQAWQAEPVAVVPAMAHPEPETEDDRQWKPLIDPMKVLGGIARSKRLILATTLLGALVGVAIALSTPKKYEAATELLIDPRDLKIVDRDLTQAGFSNEATLAIVENQVRVITSGTVLGKVVDELKLGDDPEFNGTGGGGLMPDIRSILSGSAGADNPERRRAVAIANLAERLDVARGGKTFVVVIAVTTLDGEKSALIANTMADVFLRTYGELQSDTAGRAAQELNARLDELRAGLEAAERKVENFKAENDIVGAQGRLITDDQILKLNDQLSVARAHTLELNAKAASAREIDVDSVLGGALPEEISSSTMTELRAQYASLRSEADRLAVRLGPRHPQLQAVQAQLAGARSQISNELRRIIASTQTELKRAVQLEQELSSRLAQLKVRQGDVGDELVTLRELERNAASQRSVYEAFLLRARETGEQKDLNTANMSVISVAHPPLLSTGPSRSTMVLAGLMLGFFAGIGIGGLRGAYESLRDTAGERRPPRSSSLKPVQDAAAPDRPSSPAESASEVDQLEAQESIEEIRASLREFRRDIEELAAQRSGRRYF